MGLIKAAKDSIGSIMADQWREFFYCDSLSDDVLMTKGQKRVTQGRNSNTKGSENIITDGSVIVVNKGQCALIVNQGQIEEVCADEGEFIFDSKTEPTVFAGDLGESLVNSAKNAFRRFTFGGNTARDQRVYYINTKEIKDNLYGTPQPIDFHLVSPKTGLELEAVVKCNGMYSFRIIDPVLFYSTQCANVEGEYSKKGEGAHMISMMKGELLTNLPVALAEVSEKGVLPSQLNLHIREIKNKLQEELTNEWTEKRGIELYAMTISATVPDEYREKLNEFNEKVTLGGDMRYQQAANISVTEGQAEMLRNFKVGGSNGQGASPMDAMMGVMAMNMMTQTMGNNQQPMMQQQPMQQQYQQPMQQQYQQPMQQQPMQQQPQMAPASQAAVLGWTCSCGHKDNQGKFCMECGNKKPDDAGWTCSCGTVNQGKFCTNCGNKKPEGAPLYKCDKCGWEPEDPKNPPKFCPNCGDAFDELDIVK